MLGKRPYGDAYCLLDDVFDPLGLFNDPLDDTTRMLSIVSCSDRLTLSDVRRLRSIRVPCSAHTWPYVEDNLDAIDGVHPYQSKN